MSDAEITPAFKRTPARELETLVGQPAGRHVDKTVDLTSIGSHELRGDCKARLLFRLVTLCCYYIQELEA
jgi:hypothetical protein